MKKRTPPVYMLHMLVLAGIIGYLGRSEEKTANVVITTADAPKAIGPYSQAIRIALIAIQ